MRKKMELLASKIDQQVMYFTDNPVNLDGDCCGYKYFLCWANTHAIYKKFKTQAETVDFLQDLIDEKIVESGNCVFTVVK